MSLPIEEPGRNTISIEICQVCERAASGFHFGANVCRSCAAFFRRTAQHQTESSKIQNSRRSCRFQKCITVGMKVDAAQSKRDQIGKRRKVGMRQEVDEVGEHHFLNQIEAAYTILENDRITVHNIDKNHRPRPISFSDLKAVYAKEMSIVYSFLCKAFQEYSQLSPDIKRSVFKNFFLSFRLLESAYFGYTNDKPDIMIIPSGDYIDVMNIYTFYDQENSIISKEKSSQCFIQQFKVQKICLFCPMTEEKIDKLEFLALIGLLVWERSSDINNEQKLNLVDFDQMRDKIVRDLLHHYESTKLYPDPTFRLAKVISFLPLIQRCTHKFQEFVEMKYIFNAYTLPRSLYDMCTPTT